MNIFIVISSKHFARKRGSLSIKLFIHREKWNIHKNIVSAPLFERILCESRFFYIIGFQINDWVLEK